jgi:hypothetical protein
MSGAIYTGSQRKTGMPIAALEFSCKAADLQNKYLEAMAAAYVTMTDIPPDEAVLVSDMYQREHGITNVFYFITREEARERGLME